MCRTWCATCEYIPQRKKLKWADVLGRSTCCGSILKSCARSHKFHLHTIKARGDERVFPRWLPIAETSSAHSILWVSLIITRYSCTHIPNPTRSRKFRYKVHANLYRSGIKKCFIAETLQIGSHIYASMDHVRSVFTPEMNEPVNFMNYIAIQSNRAHACSPVRLLSRTQLSGSNRFIVYISYFGEQE